MPSDSTFPPSAFVAPVQRPARALGVRINGLNHHLREWPGSGGQRVLLLHGWMDDSSSWQFLVDQLPASWHLIAPDWRGFGGSEWAREGYWFLQYQADLDALLRHLETHWGGGAVDLVGHSMGGNIACTYAGLRAERVRRLVSLEGFGLPDSDPEKAPGRLLDWLASLDTPHRLRDYPDLPTLARRLMSANPRLTESRAGFLAHAQSRFTPQGWRLRHDPRHKAPGPYGYRLAENMAVWRQVQAPTLWVLGAESDLIKRFHGEDDADLAARAACFANIRRMTLPDAGHMLQHDQPEALAGLLLDFLAQ
jgi:pimeloyl-ACP methyl ester carboxylesterase